jgi:hypothetical protein
LRCGDGTTTEFSEIVAAEIEEKLNAPGGPSLLAHIAYVYTQEAKSHSGRWLGLEGFVTGIQETGHYISEAASVIGCTRLPLSDTHHTHHTG